MKYVEFMLEHTQTTIIGINTARGNALSFFRCTYPRLTFSCTDPRPTCKVHNHVFGWTRERERLVYILRTWNLFGGTHSLYGSSYESHRIWIVWMVQSRVGVIGRRTREKYELGLGQDKRAWEQLGPGKWKGKDTGCFKDMNLPVVPTRIVPTTASRVANATDNTLGQICASCPQKSWVPGLHHLSDGGKLGERIGLKAIESTRLIAFPPRFLHHVIKIDIPVKTHW